MYYLFMWKDGEAKGGLGDLVQKHENVVKLLRWARNHQGFDKYEILSENFVSVSSGYVSNIEMV